MKIAVYGDSFGEYSKESKTTSWPYLVAQKLNATVFENFCAGGTSTFYSYKKFIANYKNFDLNIFLVTDPFRYTSTLNVNGTHSFVSSLSCLDNLSNVNEWSKFDKQLAEFLRGWFISLDTEFMETAQELLIKEIESLSSNVLILPCFQSSFNQNRRIEKNIETFSLLKITVMQGFMLGMNKGQKFDGRPFRENPNFISCHMTPETNAVLSDIIVDHLLNKKPLFVPEKISHNFSAEHYFTFTD